MISSYVGSGLKMMLLSFPTEFIDIPEDQLVQIVTGMDC